VCSEISKQKTRCSFGKKVYCCPRSDQVTKIAVRVGGIEPAKTISAGQVSALSKKGPEISFYTSASPMLATLVDKVFDDDDWLYEISGTAIGL